MISATIMIVGFVTLVTLGFTILAITMFSRGKNTALDIENVKQLMSYSVIENHGGYNAEDDDSYYEEESEYSNYSDNYNMRDIMTGPGEFLTAVNHNHIKRPAYLQFR